MCGGGSFGQYAVSFWVAELKEQQDFNTHAEKIFNTIKKYSGVREVYFDPAEGKMTLLCVYGQTDRDVLATSIAQLGYTVVR